MIIVGIIYGLGSNLAGPEVFSIACLKIVTANDTSRGKGQHNLNLRILSNSPVSPLPPWHHDIRQMDVDISVLALVGDHCEL